MCMDFFSECISMHHRYPGAHKGQQRTSNPLELELQMVTSCHMHAGTQTWVLSKNRTISPVPSYLLMFWRCGVKKVNGDGAVVLLVCGHICANCSYQKGLQPQWKNTQHGRGTVLWEERQSNLLVTFSLNRQRQRQMS